MIRLRVRRLRRLQRVLRRRVRLRNRRVHLRERQVDFRHQRVPRVPLARRDLRSRRRAADRGETPLVAGLRPHFVLRRAVAHIDKDLDRAASGQIRIRNLRFPAARLRIESRQPRFRLAVPDVAVLRLHRHRVADQKIVHFRQFFRRGQPVHPQPLTNLTDLLETQEN